MNAGIISLFLFLFELGILGLTFRYGKNYTYFTNVIPILVLLQLYQLSEFLICNTDLYWIGPIAFTIITFLPPTGYHFATQIVGWKYKDYVIGYLLGLLFSLYYLFTPDSVNLKTCNPYYAVYDFQGSPYYGYYYIGFLTYVVLFLGIHLIVKKGKYPRNATKGLLLGYLAFMLPMIILVIWDSHYLITVTSVMCKFALMLALSLGIMTNKSVV